MSATTRHVLAAVPVLAVLAAQACFSSSSSPTAAGPGVTGDDSGATDATTFPPGDTGAPGPDTSASDDSGASNDSGAQGVSDAGSPDGNPCGDAVRVDLGTGTLAANFIGAAQSLGRHVAVWPDDPYQTDASAGHLRARVFDGDAGAVDLGPVSSGNNAGVAFAVDGIGQGFLAWAPSYGAGTFATSRFDFSTYTPLSPIPAGFPNDIALAPLPVGAISVHPAPNGTNYSVSYASVEWVDGGPDAGWVSTGLTTTGSAMASPAIHTNAAGQAVAAWSEVGTGPASFTLHAVAYNGTSWGSAASLTLQGDGGAGQVPSVFAYAMHANGDALFLLYYSDKLEARTFVASTGQFQAPTAVVSPGQGNLVIWSPSYNTDRWAVIDSSDRETVVWPMYEDGGIAYAQLYASRNLGSGWTAPEPIGTTAGADYQVVLDPSSDKVVVGADEWLRSIPATGTTWSNMGVLPDVPNRNGAITFDGPTTVSVHAAPISKFGSSLGVYAVRCAL